MSSITLPDRSFEIDKDINEHWKVKLSSNGSLDDIIVQLLNSTKFKKLTEILPESQDFFGNMNLSLEYTSQDKIKIFSIPGFTINVEKLSIDFTSEKISLEDNLELIFKFNLRNLDIRIGSSKDDGFINKLLSGNDVQGNVDLTVGYSSIDGIFFGGSGGLELTIPVHKQLGPLYIQELHLNLEFTPPSGISFLGTFTAQLGPISASVEKLGIKFPVTSSDSALGFKFERPTFVPPIGADISIKSGPITGGGFLRNDKVNHRYDGILQLDFDKIALTAIGLITTKLPSETQNEPIKKGFSMLMLITAEFDPPFALAYNFYLKGVGGLIGINRAMNVDFLRDGIRNGTLDSILFPQDPIVNANRIISDLNEAFPPTDGRHIFGPIVKIIWNNPPIISGDVGILIEVPSPIKIALIGQLDAILPEKEKKIVEIHLDILGLLDFDKKELSIDASLYQSKILRFSLVGDAALRLNWGNQPQFGFSCGGFHPKAKMPPKFPSLRRLGISLGSGNNPRLNLDSYLAITSNSFQFGARLEVYAKKGRFSIEGHMGFDALFIFSPFSFMIGIGAGVAIKDGNSTLMSALLELDLSGPSPWRAKGYVQFEILWIDIKIDFDASWGSKRIVNPPTMDAWPLLHNALNDPSNWAGVLPSSKDMIVSLRDSENTTNEDPSILVQPMGALEIRQTVLPLDVKLKKIGTSLIDGTDEFSINSVCVQKNDGSSECLEITSLKEHFAPCQFQNCSDAEKLSKTFEKFNAGIKIISDKIDYGPSKTIDSKYESSVMDDSKIIHKIGQTPAHWIVQSALLMGCATMQNSLHAQGINKFTKKRIKAKISLKEEEFVIASTSNATIVSELNTESKTFVQCQQRLTEHFISHPEDRQYLQVIPMHEVA